MATEEHASTRRARLAESLRGFGPAGTIVFFAIIGAAVYFTPLGAALALAWAWLSRTPWRALGLVRPRSWLVTIGAGIALGLAEKFLMKAIVLPLLGAPPTNAAFAHVATDSPQKLMFLLAYVIIGAGFCEELVFRGYLFDRLGKLFGDGWPQRALIVVVTAAFFGALHYYPQGIFGVENAAIGGFISAAIYALNGKRLWLLVVMHATFDIAAFTMIYFGWEAAVSHLIFH